MPQIQDYASHVTAQGSLDVRANADDFGGQVGAGMQTLGRGVQAAAEPVQQANEAQDVTNVHVNMAKARAEWTQTLQDRERNATPGDDAFAPTLMKDMDAYFADFGKSVQTRRGQQTYQSLAASMSSEFGQRAIGMQAELSARDATNKYDTLLKSFGSAAYNDPSQREASLEQARAAIDDPAGIFGRVPKTARDAFKAKIENDINYATARGAAARNPEAVLGSFAPDKLAEFEPAKKIVQSNAATGGRVSISEGAMKWAPQVTAAGATTGVNPNILLAQIDKESGGKEGLTSPAGAEGVAQFMPDTAKQYGVDVKNPHSSINGQAAYMGDLLQQFNGDYSKALAAYNWGPGNMAKVLSRYGSDWQNHLPAETSNYVATILAKSGAVAAPGGPDPVVPPQPTGDPNPPQARTPAESSLPFMSGLSWEQQDQVVNESVRLMHTKMAMAERQRIEAERVKKEAQDVKMDGFLQQIVDPKTNGAFSEHAVLEDPTLSWQQKQHMVDYNFSRQREMNSASETKTNPTEVRGLMLQIHAADDDPTKTYNMDPVMESYRLGRISTNEMRMLRTEVEQLKSGDGNSFMKQMHSAREVVYTALTRSIMGQMTPEVAADAAYRFNRDLERQAAALRKENKDPSVLLDPMSRDYVLKPERIQSYMQSSQAALHSAAAKTADQEKATLPTSKDYDSLPKGASYTDPQGNVRVKG